MNDEPKDTLTISITGNLTIARADLEQLLRGLPVASPAPQAVAPPETRSIRPAEVERGLPRLAYTVEETAEALGVSKVSVYRLIERRLLKTSLALRRKLISRAEIERFLRETSSGV
jgi:excisionase family DNA binding protein